MDELAIFTHARDLADSVERDAYLRQACAANEPLRARVEALLSSERAAGSFLQGAAPGLCATEQPPAQPREHEHPGAIIGHFKLLEQIGEGGMGVVYVAEQTQPVRRRVALKIIKPGMDTKQVIARFEAERQALAMMDHPNIAKILDAGTVGERSEVSGQKSDGAEQHSLTSDLRSLTSPAARPFFVMELVRGMPITDYCDKARLSPRHRLALFADVCHAVQHAHQKGVIHRDLKPGNVLVTLHDGKPVVKVIDFGVAKAICGAGAPAGHTVYTALNQLIGTPLYMSPEQAEMSGLDVDTRSDVYSLGVLLYELLTGQTPFDKERLKSVGLDEMRRIIREDDPLPPSRRLSTLGAAAISTASQHRGLDERRLNKILSGELDWIVMKSLEKDRSLRYESASALAADIQRYLSDEPVLACPPTTMYRFQKFARKHRPALATAAAIAACLLLGTTVSAWQAVRATTAEAQANANEQKAVANEQKAVANEQKAIANEQKANVSAAAAEEKAQEATTERDEAQRQRDEVKSLAQQLQRTLYASNMNLAQNAWDAGNISRVKELLNKHRPKDGQDDLRSFEWHYLSRLCQSELYTIRGGTAGWEDIAFSPDGKRFASTGGSGIIKIWDAETGKELVVIKDPSLTALSVDFSPDGKRLAACGWWDYKAPRYVPGDIKIWDAETGQELLSMPGHQACDSDVAFSPDGKRIAAGGGIFVDNSGKEPTPELSVWDAQTGEKVLDVAMSGTGSIESIGFSPDGKRLAAAFSSFSAPAVKVWDAQTGAQQLSLEARFGSASSVAFSPDGKRLAGSRQIWDVASRTELLSFEKDSRTAASSILEFSPDGKHVACRNSAVIEIRDAQSAELVRTLKGHTGPIYFARFSPDGKKLVSRSGDRSIKMWDVTTSQEARVVSDVIPAPRSAIFSPDGKRVAYREVSRDSPATTSRSFEFKISELPTGRELFTTKTPENVFSAQIAFSADGKRLVCATQKEARILDGLTGKELVTLTGPCRNPVFSPNGQRLACQEKDGFVKVWDSENGQELRVIKVHPVPANGLINTTRINELVYSPDGKRLATHSADGTARIFYAQTGKELLQIKLRIPREQRSGALAFSPDGKRLAASCLASDYSASSGGIGEIKICDSGSGKELLTLKGHTALVGSIAFSPDGKRLISASGFPGGPAPGEVKLWDADNGYELLTFKGGASRVAFSSDGKWLTTDAGNAVNIYDATPRPEKP